VKRLLAELSSEHKAVKGNLLHALGKVVPTHLLDRGLLAKLGTTHGADPWIDEEEGAAAAGLDEACAEAEALVGLPRRSGGAS
jgi:tRNA 2-thiocytidine biosynthesis protein TtcA